ncbi:MAG: O-linked N-acetylglucosamine transferase, SPINDLY family protein, partial [Fibrobacter sp.]|nr:O-linked N-acetylglucosamine transferase, SPINDLY family protein [Fibrobacter sp.]
ISKKDFVKAKEYYHRALVIKPDNAEAHYNLGLIMREWNRIDEAVICYKNSLRFDSEQTLAMINLGECFQARGEIEESEDLFRKVIKIDPVNKIAWDNYLLSMNYNPSYSPVQIYDAHVQWGQLFKPVETVCSNSKDTAKRLRIGYVSPDFRHHPSAAFLEPILKNHNHTDFTIYCYSQTLQQDNFTEKFKTYCDYWRDIRDVSDIECAEMVKTDQIDILVDCAGHMDGNRLGVFALKPAPVQITGIGYPNTSGLKSIDYRITDTVTDPPGETPVNTEHLLYLQNGFCCYNPPVQAPEISNLPARKNGFITFGSLHTPARLNKNVIELWAEVLKCVKDSRLLIFRNTLSTEIINRLRRFFECLGVENNRVEYCSTISAGGYLNIYSRIDILLDTFPWSGHTTACEALWMGVPVITLRGNRYAGRMVSSVLSRICRTDYIAEDKNSYRAIALQKSSDISALESDRYTLRNAMQNSLLCDGEKYTMELESRYREVWSRWCSESAQ